MKMDRREAIQRAALIMGYAITGPALVGVLNGCKSSPELAFKPELLNEDQASIVSIVSELIIPRTETPGAIDVGVPSFIDQMVKNVYPQESKDKFLKDLNEFNEGARKDHRKTFLECNDDEQLAYFTAQHTDAINKTTGSGSTGWWNAGMASNKPFVMELKELTLLGFFTSEAGATQVLQYKQVPGPYQGCVPLTTVGKTWAT
jgi:gluconate 2-dehydrogenase gamma chain